MIYEFLEPESQPLEAADQELVNWTAENFDDFGDNFFNEDEAIDIAQYNYECRVYGEKNKQIVRRAR